MELENIEVSYKALLQAEKEIDKKYWYLFGSSRKYLE